MIGKFSPKLDSIYKVTKLEKALLFVNLILWAIFAIFSYAYVDLNLTISQNPVVLDFVAFMQQLGYYNRPQATLIYLALLTLAFAFFVLNLWLFYKSKIGLKYLAISTVANTAVLIFAYPFLSSDLFNYLFDAKIITHYQASPYTNRPMDFAGDEWLRFMRWTHRYSPYGPLWLGMSLVPAFLGFGKFILNFLMFKVMIATFHLLNTYIIFKTLKKISPQLVLLGTAFYGINPLFLIEGVVSAHNDVVLATAMLASIYFLATGRKALSFLSLFAGAATKYIPILNLPWLLLWMIIPKIRNSVFLANRRIERIEWLILANLATMATFTYIYSSFRVTAPFVSGGATQVQFQPWYLFWTIPFIAVLPKTPLIVISLALAIGAMLRYLPYLYYGDWSQPGTIAFMQVVTTAPAILVGLFLLAKKLAAKK